MQVGFLGGSSLAELGPASDVKFFFKCAAHYGPNRDPEMNWDLITCRLYRRFVRLVDAEETHSLMSRLEQSLLNVRTSDVDRSRAKYGIHSTLGFAMPTLKDVFDTYFRHFTYCNESAVLFFQTWSIEQPVRIVRSALPGFLVDKKRVLSEYDDLTGQPLWLGHRTT